MDSPCDPCNKSSKIEQMMMVEDNGPRSNPRSPGGEPAETNLRLHRLTRRYVLLWIAIVLQLIPEFYVLSKRNFKVPGYDQVVSSGLWLLPSVATTGSHPEHDQSPVNHHEDGLDVETSSSGVGDNQQDSLPSDEASTATRMPDWLTPTKYPVKFHVIGFPRTGTTYLLHDWLPNHPHVCVMGSNHKRPHCRAKGYRDSELLLRKDRVRIIIKALSDTDRFIIGIRNPIHWLESYYNHRVRSGLISPQNLTLNDLRGKAGADDQNCPWFVCPDNARFHYWMSQLGKTKLETHDEAVLLSRAGFSKYREKHMPVPQPIFLYETSQLNAHENPRVAQTLQHDLSLFLGLTNVSTTKQQQEQELQNQLPPMPQPRLDRRKKQQSPEAERDGTINICDPEYEELRAEMVETSSSVASWVLSFLRESDHVMISSPDYFEQKLEEWHYDPCIPT